MKPTFAKVLSRLRREAGYSQRLAATDLGISQALLSHYENGAREPKLEFVVKACDYYGVSADYILGRSDVRGDKTIQIVEALGNIVGELDVLKATEVTLLAKLKQLTISDS